MASLARVFLLGFTQYRFTTQLGPMVSNPYTRPQPLSGSSRGDLRYGAIISRNQPFECRLHRRKTGPSISSQYARIQRDHSWPRVSRANAFLHLSRLKGHIAVPFTDPTTIDVGKAERAQRSLACRGARPSILIAVQSLVCSASAQHRQTI